MLQLARYEEVSCKEASRSKLAKELDKAMRELEWPKMPEEEDLLDDYMECVESICKLGHPEDSLFHFKERDGWNR